MNALATGRKLVDNQSIGEAIVKLRFDPLPTFQLTPHSDSSHVYVPHHSLPTAMASPESTAPPVLQEFESEHMKALTSLPILICKETGKRHILWKDVKDTFEGIDYLKAEKKELCS